MEKYSFLMSVYAKENPEYLHESIESMLSQTVAPDEIVIVEDGPLTPELEHEIELFSKDNSSLFTIIPLPVNGGLGNALNIGLHRCRNNLVARMDSDDISFPNRCELQLQVFENNPTLSIVGGQIKEFINDDVNNIVRSRSVPTNFNDIIDFSKRRSPFNHPTVMYKRDDILSVGGYPSSGRKEDLDLFLLLLSSGFTATNLKDYVLFYRTSRANQERRTNWNNCREYIKIIKKYYKRKYCSLWDLIVVCVGQVVFHFSPKSIKGILNKILRKEIKNGNTN